MTLSAVRAPVSRAILIFGGPSEERFVSVASAQNVLAQSRIPLETWFIDRNLGLHIVKPQLVLEHKEPFTRQFESGTIAQDLDKALASHDPRLPFFLGMHGTWGEDGALQEKLEQGGFSFTGSGSLACRVAFDKVKAKRAVAGAGFLVPLAINLLRGEPWETVLTEVYQKHGAFVLKPECNGSSIGLHIVKDQASLIKAYTTCSQNGARRVGDDGEFIAETFVSGREFTVGVLQTADGLRALPVSEILLDHDASFDYEGKYLGRNSTEITPAKIDASLSEQLGAIALAAHTSCGCRGYSRTDIILSEKGPVFLEINTHPGLTKASFIPQQLAAAGLDFPEFLANQLALV